VSSIRRRVGGTTTPPDYQARSAGRAGTSATDASKSTMYSGVRPRSDLCTEIAETPQQRRYSTETREIFVSVNFNRRAQCTTTQFIYYAFILPISLVIKGISR